MPRTRIAASVAGERALRSCPLEATVDHLCPSCTGTVASFGEAEDAYLRRPLASGVPASRKRRGTRDRTELCRVSQRSQCCDESVHWLPTLHDLSQSIHLYSE